MQSIYENVGIFNDTCVKSFFSINDTTKIIKIEATPRGKVFENI